MTLGNISPTTMFIEMVKNAATFKFSRKQKGHHFLFLSIKVYLGKNSIFKKFM